MPDTTTTISGEQRDALYQLVRDRLGGLNDVWIAMEQNKDFATAERLGREFRGDFRLLEDLGWIDNAAPSTVPVLLEGGETWRSANDFDIAWQNPPELDRAPIAAAHFRLCPIGGGQCVTGSHGGISIARIDDLAVPSPGEWALGLWREDAAHNQQSGNASLPVRLRFDPEPPRFGGFEPLSPSDPTRVSVQVSDPISGLSGGEVAIGRLGSGVWQVLPTTRESTRLLARISKERRFELIGLARSLVARRLKQTRMLRLRPVLSYASWRVHQALETLEGSRESRSTFSTVRSTAASTRR